MSRPFFSSLFVASMSGCALVAGLDDFHPAEGGGASGGFGGGPVEGGGGDTNHGGSGGNGTGCADHLLITEVRTYGSAAGTDDFVEIYNPTDAIISLFDVSLQGRAPTGTIGERWRGTSNDELGPHEFFLVAGQNFDDGPTPDKVLDVNKSFGDNFIILLNAPSGALLDGVCVCTANCDSPDWNGCDGVVLDNPGVVDGAQVPTDDSLQRAPQCEDDDEKSDFHVAPATPKADNVP